MISHFDLALLKEADGSTISSETQQEFTNWGKTVKNRPAVTFYPKTKVGVANAVKFAKRHQLRVHASGYRHSWAPLFSEEGQVLIAMLPHKETNQLPAIHPPLNNHDELRGIHAAGEEFKDTDGKLKQLFKIGPAVTNEQLRVWALQNWQSGKPAHCFSKNVVMGESSVGGIITNMCHGAGIRNQTIADDVVAIEFINAKGELQTVTDPELIRSAAGSFGMFGVVTNITVKLERMPHVRMNPKKTDIALAVPPPADYKLSPTIPQAFFKNFSENKRKIAEDDFRKRCEQSDYEEEFWFPTHNQVWTNAWKEDGEAKESKDYPGKCVRNFQEFEELAANLANQSIMKLLPDHVKTELLSKFAMLTMDVGPITTPKVDAMHFRGGVQNMRVQDMEFEIGIPRDKDGKLDWGIAQRAWWDAITIFYEYAAKNKFPQQMPLEMRIMGGSNMTMATQRGNPATCSIEVLTIQEGLVDPVLWKQYLQDVADKWASYTDYQGKPLRVVPHIAKQWEGITIQRPGEPRFDAQSYFKKIFKSNIQEFNHHRASVARAGGYTIEEMNMFSNSFLDFMFNGKEKVERRYSATTPALTALLHKPAHVVCPVTAERHLRTLLTKAQQEQRERHADIMSDRKPSTVELMQILNTSSGVKPKPAIVTLHRDSRLGAQHSGLWASGVWASGVRHRAMLCHPEGSEGSLHCHQILRYRSE